MRHLQKIFQWKGASHPSLEKNAWFWYVNGNLCHKSWVLTIGIAGLIPGQKILGENLCSWFEIDENQTNAKNCAFLLITALKRRNFDDEHNDRMLEFFDMKCELCECKFTTLKHAKLHYFDAHKISDGYLKCCNFKFETNRKINDHVRYHLDPESFR